MAAVRSHVRELRRRAGLSQQELAARVGLSRQALGAVEAGTSVPSTAAALELARALGCRVEDLFELAGDPLDVAAGDARGRVRLGLVGGRWIAHALAGEEEVAPADALVTRGRTARPLRDVAALRQNLLVAGCDPAIGVLAGHLLEGGLRLHWLAASSTAALEAYAAGRVHGAGVHFFEAAADDAVRVHLATWETGLVARRGARVRRAADLAGLRVV
jgi:putative molybdopterin biosynthesis protein